MFCTPLSHSGASGDSFDVLEGQYYVAFLPEMKYHQGFTTEI